MAILNSLGAFCLRQVVGGVCSALGVGFAADSVNRVAAFLNQQKSSSCVLVFPSNTKVDK
jgi:hypothetical protein